MKKIFTMLNTLTVTLALLAALIVTLPAYAVGSIIYAAPGGLTSGACSSWANACDLQYALTRAAVSSGQIWVSAGTYKPTTTTDRTISFVLNNFVAVYGGFNGTETLLSQRNPAANVTTLSGDIGIQGDKSDNSYHVVVGSGTDSSAILDGFTITGGNANGSGGCPDPGTACGGGMFNNSGSPTVRNVTFSGNNAAGVGGGMYDTYSSGPTLTNVTFSGNSATVYGGGIYSSRGSTLIITNSTLSGNTSTVDGGGIYISSSTLTVINSTLSGNTSGRGSGIYESYSGLTVSGSTFDTNASTNEGGGMYLREGTLTVSGSTFTGNNGGSYGGGIEIVGGTLTVSGSTFSGNSAATGGGLYTQDSDGTVTLINSTFTGNMASYYAGGLAAYGNATTIITNSTFSGNSAATGAGGGISNSGLLNLNNSIVANSTGSDCIDNGTVTAQYSLIGDGSCGITAGVNGNLTGDPLLNALADNGGPTETMALQDGSPAINAGDNALAVDENNLPLAYDQRGSGYDRIIGGTVDMGAYEAATTVQITVATDPSGLSFSVDGTAYTSSQTFIWTPGSSHTLAATSPQAGTPGMQYAFDNWSDGGALSHSVTAPAVDSTYTAAFKTQYQLTTAVDPSNGGSISPASGAYYDANTEVSLTATANSGFAFLSWTGAVTDAASANTTITMSGPQNVTASFKASTSLLYNGGQLVNIGTSFNAAAKLSSPASACLSGQTIDFSLDTNPLDGSAGPYSLGSAVTGSDGQASLTVSTSGWQEGIYDITASFAGTTNCDPASDDATLTAANPGNSATGGGWYTLSGSGHINFGFNVRKADNKCKTDCAYKGQALLINNGKWRIKGTLDSYVQTSTGQGAASGTGDLCWWDQSLNGGLGDWSLAQSGISFTINFYDSGQTGKGKKSTGSDMFGINIQYTPVPPQPSSLPNSDPQPLKGGNITVN